MLRLQSGTGSLIGGLFAAIVGSLCCVGPLVLVSIGISGVWISNLTALEPYRPALIGLAALFLWFAYRKIYRPVVDCAPGTVCAMPSTRRLHKLSFWIVTLLTIVAFGLPDVAKFFY